MRFVTITISAVAGSLVALATATPIPNESLELERRTAGGHGIAIPLTREVPFLNSNKTLDIRDAISSHAISVEEKILSGLDNYKMNTGATHPFAVKRIESGLEIRGAKVPLTIFENDMWTGEISIGTPPKTLKMFIDTGSADMWVLETGCVGIPGNRDLWDPKSSQSSKTQEGSFQLQYSAGTIAKGDVYTDNVTIGGFTADPQTFGSVTSYAMVQMETIAFPADGLLGLAFPSVATDGASSLFYSLLKQHKLINPTISFKLTSSGAEMYLGGANSMMYTGDIAYTRITNPGFWQVSMDDVRVGGDKIFENIPAIFDTGANFIFGDWDQVAELYGRFGGTVIELNKGYGYYYLPCDSFPTVSFTFGGKTYEIPPEIHRLKPIWKDPSKCYSVIVARRSLGLWSIGSPFLQGVYSVFDYGTLQVGFAELA